MPNTAPRARLVLPIPIALALAVSGLTPANAPADDQPPTAPKPSDDPRHILNGRIIPDEGYCDQPYVVVADDGQWVCVMTTGAGVEGQPGQRVVSTRSPDLGRTWSPLVPVEPADGPEASWAMPVKVASGRIYVIYVHNSENIREIPGVRPPSLAARVDTLGQYVFKYSDDHGRTWSRERFVIPVPESPLDRANNLRGAVRFFWGVGKPVVHGENVTFGFAKVGKWGTPGTMVESRGFLLSSDNLLREPDPARVRWKLLPDPETDGFRAPKGPVCDEANLVVLSDGTLYVTCRTIDGYPAQFLGTDGGASWTEPRYLARNPGGPLLKHPRAANFVKKFANGRYLYWFHNHGGESVHREGWNPYADRNPAWVAAGTERDGTIHWSEPEILLYDDDPAVRISYPDFVETDDGRVFVTETQKEVARVHEIDPELLDGLWNMGRVARPFQAPNTVRWTLPDDPELDLHPDAHRDPALFSLTMPPLPHPDTRLGFAIEFEVEFRELTAGQILLDARAPDGRGLLVDLSPRSAIRVVLDDGKSSVSWESDPGTGPGTLAVGRKHHVAVRFDAGPRILMFQIDGVLNDGGTLRQFGWGRVPPDFGDYNGAARARLVPDGRFFGTLRAVRIHDRCPTTAQTVAARLATLPNTPATENPQRKP